MDELLQLEQNLSRLLTAHQQLQRDNNALTEQLQTKENELFELRKALEQTQKDLKNLQTAHALVVDSPERTRAKRHVQSMIADIDKIIAIVKTGQ